MNVNDGQSFGNFGNDVLRPIGANESSSVTIFLIVDFRDNLQRKIQRRDGRRAKRFSPSITAQQSKHQPKDTQNWKEPSPRPHNLWCWNPKQPSMKLLSPTALLSALALPSLLGAFAPPLSGVRRQHAVIGGLGATVEKESMVTEPAKANLATPLVPFKNIMAANRAEIAVRIMRASTELNTGTVGIYVNEDRYSQHRWGADRSFLLEKDADATPISAYLDIPQIIQIAKDADVDAIHPGYGFLSESPAFAQACSDAGITFVGPTVDNLLRFSDKTSARQAAIDAGVPVVPGSDGALKTSAEVVEFVEGIGLPIIIKVNFFCFWSFMLCFLCLSSLLTLPIGLHGWRW